MQTTKSIVVKLYLDPDTYLDTKAKCDAPGISMSSAGNLALRQWQPAHISRRPAANDMPGPGLKRALQFPGARRVGAPTRHMRV